MNLLTIKNVFRNIASLHNAYLIQFIKKILMHVHQGERICKTAHIFLGRVARKHDFIACEQEKHISINMCSLINTYATNFNILASFYS